jgi:3',5'-cyclic AMP phosphodiesterase CpdA
VTGDLADHATDDEYARLKATLATLNVPTYVLPGNQDDRDCFRKHFALAGEPGEPVHYAADLGPLRLVALDTTKPGADDGELGEDQLGWLESALSAAQEATTLIAMHHPPFETGMPAWDAIGLCADDRSDLAKIVRRHPQVCGIVAGHVHRLLIAEVGGTVALTAPSTYVQGRLRFCASRLEFDLGTPGLLVHTLLGRELVSTVHHVVSHTVF